MPGMCGLLQLPEFLLKIEEQENFPFYGICKSVKIIRRNSKKLRKIFTITLCNAFVDVVLYQMT